MFSMIFNGIKSVLGVGADGSSNVMKAASGIGNWIDGQQFTEQEKADFNGKMVEHYSDFMKSTVAENTQRSLTRRNIAIWVIRTEIAMLVSSAILYRLDAELSLYIYKIATTNPMDYLVLGIGAFFFGAHLVRQLPSNKK
jgi:hypothetical protein